MINNNLKYDFSLFGSDENALSKSFAFVLASDKEKYCKTFLEEIGVDTKNIDFSKVKIITQKRDENLANNMSEKTGITDIEIKDEKTFHVIVECKIGNAYVGENQKNKYRERLETESNCEKKILCSLTVCKYAKNLQSENKSSVAIEEKNICWNDVKEMLKKIENDKLIQDFKTFLETEEKSTNDKNENGRKYKFLNQDDILIQNLSIESEIDLLQNYVFRHEKTKVVPKKFCPYYTDCAVKYLKKSVFTDCIINLQELNTHGGYFIADVKYVLRGTKGQVKQELKKYEKEVSVTTFKKWITGLDGTSKHIKTKRDNGKNPDGIYTYYFFDEPQSIAKFAELPESSGPKKIIKDTTGAEHSTDNWIGNKIPQNRCVTFEQLKKYLHS